MFLPPLQNALVLTGPTGSGKTQLGIELARRLDAEIISMDSMAVYRGMDIGTAKPTRAEQAEVAHHLIDVLEPWQSASVAWWLDQAKQCAADIEARGKQVLFVGGTPLYLKALTAGLFDGPPADEAIRGRLMQEIQTLGPGALHERLSAVDPVCAERIHPNDARRIIRAIEVYELTGKPMSAWQTQWGGRKQESGVRGQGSGVRGQESGVRGQESGDRGQGSGGMRQESGIMRRESDVKSLTPDSCPLTPDPCLLTPDSCPLTPDSCLLTPDSCLWLDLARAEIYERIDRRVEAMFAAGWLDEARQLRSMERPLSREAQHAVGYQEMFALLDGTIEQDEAIVRVQMRTRNFAKRQITWFRHLPGCKPVSMELTWTLWQGKMKR